jgi:PilZ domain
VNGRCSDLSERGCYVDTLSPLTLGAVVRVRIVRNEREFEAEAIVAYAQIPMGMGLAFTGMKSEDQETLRCWISELSGGQPCELAATLATPTIVPEAGTNEKMAAIQPILYGLITLLIRKNVITETEGAGLLRQLFQ